MSGRVGEPKTTHNLETVVHPQTGAGVEIFYADRALAASFGAHAGWFWWACRFGSAGGGVDWRICQQLCIPKFRDAQREDC